MELNNDIHTEHEHATTSLKVLLLVFAVVLVSALAYLVWAQNTAPDTTDDSAAVTKKTTVDPTADWKTYTNTELNISVKYPPTYVVAQDSVSGVIIFRKAASTGEGDYPEMAITAKNTNMTLAQFLAAEKAGTRFAGEQQTTVSGQAAYEGMNLGILTAYGMLTVYGGNSYNLVMKSANQDTLSDVKTGLTADQKLMITSFSFSK
ncbi:MAG: hypothetical protein NUV80_05095 [Candidatus Berkelbacteria bacterium]|nr:hypothetical protein [Candidatus Berkelbacteria bacterium]MCR4307914.1 hypothetical protein [Candidatus Berkelbacteria bacterium]